MSRYPSTRKRVEIPAELYAELAKDADRLGMATQALITSMLTRTLVQDRARAGVPFKDREAILRSKAPSKKGLASFYAAAFAAADDIKEQIAGAGKAGGAK